MTGIGGVLSGGSGGSSFLDGYDSVTEVGRGGSGVVLKAWQPDFSRWVAIKVLRIASDHAPLSQFMRERMAIGAMSGHPNIVTVYDAGSTTDLIGFIVMEYLPDGTLADRLRHGPLGWPEAVDIGVRLSGALESAHRSGVLHLDVKPENVFLSQDYDTVKLGDFGIAQVRGQVTTRTGTISGTLLHMAPETLREQPATPACDVYSLGSTLFTLIEGHAPFGRPGEADPVVMARMLSDERAAPQFRSADLPPLLASTIERALAPAPGDRQASVAELGNELRAVQAAAGVTLTPMFVKTAPGPPLPTSHPDEVTVPPRPTPAGTGDEEQAPVGTRRPRKAVLGALAAVALTIAMAVVLVTEPWSGPDAPPGRNPPTTVLGPAPAAPVQEFRDDFSNPSRWPRGNNYGFDGGGRYRVRLDRDHTHLAIDPTDGEGPLRALFAPGANVAVEVDAEVVSGTNGGMGLFCRMQPGRTDRYRAVVFPTGQWNISRDSKDTPLASGVTSVPAENGVYRLRLECSGTTQGTTVTFFVGSKLIGQWTDTDALDGGQAGFQAATANAPFADVRFDNFLISEL